MELTFNEWFVIGNMVFVVVTLILFGAVTWEKYNPKHVFWNRMNILALFVIFMTLFSIIPQLFLVGRTYNECSFLHHWAGTFYHLTNALTRVFFLARSNMVVQHDLRQIRIGRGLLYFWLAFVVSSVIGLNITMSVVIVPPMNVCVGVLNQAFAFVFAIVVPILYDLVINARFIYFILDTSKAAGSINSSTRRLLVLTCILCFLTMVFSIVVGLIIMGIIPLPNMSLLTPILALEQAFSASMMAWPAIIVRLMKAIHDIPSRLDVGSKTGDGGSKQGMVSKNPFGWGPGSPNTFPTATSAVL